jgi:hypothetical protein
MRFFPLLLRVVLSIALVATGLQSAVARVHVHATSDQDAARVAVAVAVAVAQPAEDHRDHCETPSVSGSGAMPAEDATDAMSGSGPACCDGMECDGPCGQGHGVVLASIAIGADVPGSGSYVPRADLGHGAPPGSRLIRPPIA